MTSESLGLPVRKFSRDVLTDIKDMNSINLKLLIEKQKSILNDKAIKLLDNGAKLKNSIKYAEDELQNRSIGENKLSDNFEKLTIKKDSYSVSGKRNFVLNETKNALPQKKIPFLSFDEQKKAFEACTVKLNYPYTSKQDMGTHRNSCKFDEIDSDDSDITENLDSDDNDY